MIKRLLDKLRGKSTKKVIKSDSLDCPDCGGDKWFEGPSGGICVNITCTKCGSRFNDMGPFGLQRLNTVDTKIKRDDKNK